MYRSYYLKLERDHAPVLSRAWTIMHRITESSPLYDATPSSCSKDEIELDDRHPWHRRDIGPDPARASHLPRSSDPLGCSPRRHAERTADGVFVVDMTHFDEIVPTEPTQTFPYPPRSA